MQLSIFKVCKLQLPLQTVAVMAVRTQVVGLLALQECVSGLTHLHQRGLWASFEMVERWMEEKHGALQRLGF
ncbi:hypothetical protein ASE39_22585 [Acidovorax sp. Root267]|nr:hypothetical protein ASE39_22585 [Acidovorax sp. Root267]